MHSVICVSALSALHSFCKTLNILLCIRHIIQN